MKTLITIAILSLALVGSASAQTTFCTTDASGNASCNNPIEGTTSQCSGGICNTYNSQTRVYTQSYCSTPDNVGSYACNNSDGTYTRCTTTTPGNISCSTSNPSAARQQRNQAEIDGAAAVGAAGGALAVVLIERHQARKWGKKYCAEHPDCDFWERGPFHGECKHADNPMTSTTKTAPAALPKLDLSKSTPIDRTVKPYEPKPAFDPNAPMQFTLPKPAEQKSCTTLNNRHLNNRHESLCITVVGNETTYSTESVDLMGGTYTKTISKEEYSQQRSDDLKVRVAK